jgi:threonine/homoserine/homoserine lactone efflux protein
MKILRNGLATGLFLQLAIGPVFFFIINLTLQRSLLDGLMGVLAVTVVDYFYIMLAVLGVGELLENARIKRTFGVVSSLVLIIFGLILARNIMSSGVSMSTAIGSTNLISSFTSVFLLTITSPMTIIFFTGIFAAKALEYNYSKRELLIFGFGTGLATLVFMTASVIALSLVKGNIPILLMQILNLIVGCLLIGYGVVRLLTASKKKMI